MKPMLPPLCLTAPVLLILVGITSAAPPRIISSSFFEPFLFPQSGPMLNTTVAGVPGFQVTVPAVMRVTNWNQLQGNSGIELDLRDSQGFMTQVDAQWIATDISSNLYLDAGLNGDSMMMNGHLFSSTLGLTGLATVTVTSLDTAFDIASGYEVWVYVDPEGTGQSESLFVDDGTLVGAAITITDTVDDLGGGRAFDFTQDYDEATTDGLGVWARFGGLTGSSFTIEARSLVAGGAAYINGFQIVGNPVVPEPASLVLTICGVLGLCGPSVRRRAN